MKKSEMVNKILPDIKYMMKQYNCNYPYPEDVAHHVLDIVTKHGMLPPIVEEKSFQILDNGEMTYSVNEWEEDV